MSRHVRNHVYCAVCNQYTTKKRHHVHRDNVETLDTAPNAIQIWIPLVIPIESVRKLWPGYSVTTATPPPIPVVDTGNVSAPPHMNDLFRTFFPELPTANPTAEDFVNELREYIKNAPDKIEAFETGYYSDIRYWDYDIDFLKSLVLQ
jgi:hypothetical protein